MTQEGSSIESYFAFCQWTSLLLLTQRSQEPVFFFFLDWPFVALGLLQQRVAVVALAEEVESCRHSTTEYLKPDELAFEPRLRLPRLLDPNFPPLRKQTRDQAFLQVQTWLGHWRRYPQPATLFAPKSLRFDQDWRPG